MKLISHESFLFALTHPYEVTAMREMRGILIHLLLPTNPFRPQGCGPFISLLEMVRHPLIPQMPIASYTDS